MLPVNSSSITVDEALSCKLMELRWTNDDYMACLIVRLGGLHTAIKFLEVIGKHVQSFGLLEAWVEGNILGLKIVLPLFMPIVFMIYMFENL